MLHELDRSQAPTETVNLVGHNTTDTSYRAALRRAWVNESGLYLSPKVIQRLFLEWNDVQDLPY